MKQLTINGIKNKNDDWNMLLTDEEKQYIAEFMEKHKEEFHKKHFDIFCDFNFLENVLSDSRISFLNMLLDLSEKDTLNFLDTLINFTPFTDKYYVILSNMQIDKMEISGNCLENIKLLETDVATLICSPTSVVQLTSFCQAVKYSNINKLIIDEKYKDLLEVDEDIRGIIMQGRSSIEEIIAK